MRYKVSFVILLSVVLFAVSCKKWQDKPAVADPRLTNPYCNDPNAVNYNWGFPGKPDNTVCFYASDLFKGTYTYTDSVFHTDFLAISTQTYTINIYPLSQTRVALVGLCAATDTLKLTGGKAFLANIDTVIGYGQQACRPVDTIYGTITKDQAAAGVLHINFTVNSDTGITLHNGTAIKQ